MKFVCQKSELLEHLQHAQSVVNPRTTLPILSNIYIEAKDKYIEIISTDLEISIHSLCPAKVSEKGNTTIPARKFFDIVKNLPDEPITVKVNDSNVAEITCKKNIHFKLVGLPGEDFPKLPNFNKADSWDIDSKDMKKVIKKTSFAASRDENHYVLNGIYFVFSGNKLTAVATDGRRLSLVKLEKGKKKDVKADFIVPIKTINELSKLLDSSESIKVYYMGNQVKFEAGDFSLITKLIEGTFPDYEAVIPKDSGPTAVINRNIFLEALQRTSLFTSDRASSVKLMFTKDSCVLSANTPELGEAKEEIEIEYDGGDFIIAFNPAYLIDVMKNIEEEKFFFIFPEKSTAGLIKTDGDFLYVIMPMRITD